MTNVLTFASTLTSKGQTTIPKAVRDALGLSANDQIEFRIGADGVSVAKAEQDADDDPVVLAFLDFLARDMEKNPQNIKPLSQELFDEIRELVGDGPVDLDEEIVGEVAL